MQKTVVRPTLWFMGMVCLLLSGVPGPSLAEQSGNRFTLVMNGAAVKDNQTGLIWEQEPDREHDVWSRSNERCAAKEVGGQTGWRGPSVDELKTLIDLSQQDPALPAGHPFSNIKSEIFWTSTPDPKSWPGKSASSAGSR